MCLPGLQHKVSPTARANCHGHLCTLPLEGKGHGASGVTGLLPPMPEAAHTTYHNC